MVKSIIVPALPVALEKLKEIISVNENAGKNTVIFCEDRLTLAAERTVCSAVGGTFSTSVYTLARFLSSERGKRSNVLSSQGSAMAIRKIIEDHKGELKLFGKFSAAASAGAVYDTIALLYASKISADELKAARADGLLESKLSDISLIYSEYERYLQSSGKIDRNAYLGELPEVIENSKKIAGSEVVFLGFQSFTRSSSECVRSAFKSAENVSGLFIGGAEEIYVNEGAAAFEGIAEQFGGAQFERVKSTLIPEAEALRRTLFNPESYFSGKQTVTDRVRVYEASDEDEEIEFIAATIKKHVLDGGVRYGKISVMLPDVAKSERAIERIFSEFEIPYYADRRHALSEHPVCAFILNYLACVNSGCALRDVDAVVSSPLFPQSRDDKDAYRNYALRLADFRGGVRREPKKEILELMKFNYDSVQRVRETFLRGLKFLPSKGSPSDITAGIKKLFADFGVREKLEQLKEKFRDSHPTASEFSGRVYDAALSVVEEAENILGGTYMPLKEYMKILKSGFTAAEISIIPPKADAVFVGDIAATANTGCDVLFAASLTDAVPQTSADTSLLTDREIAVLETVNLDITPKIRQVNMRRRELAALNLCAFRTALYLTYPSRSGGEESNASEIVDYALKAFSQKSLGGNKNVIAVKRVKNINFAYYCSEKLPALKRLSDTPERASTVYKLLQDKGFGQEADLVLAETKRASVSFGRQLFVTYDSISPTALETYFACPYRNFMQQGLKLQEREEGAMRPLDTGNFIHTVLQNLAPAIGTCANEEEAKSRAAAEAEKLLKSKTYASLIDTKSGRYTADGLVKEAGEVTAGMYAQLANSKFEVENTEWRCEINLDSGVRINGRIDRVDRCGDMVRIIDYKTGTIDSSVTKYYMGLKLQLPLYLTAAATGRRAVGAYYFPASVEYKPKADGVFRLQGFMDGSDEVVSNSDTTLQPKQKSEYFDAYLSGRKVDSAMDNEIFADFLHYSALIARKGTREMIGGNISPSPAADACKYCKMGGSCNFAVGVDGEERSAKTVKCADIAKIVRRQRGDE